MEQKVKESCLILKKLFKPKMCIDYEMVVFVLGKHVSTTPFWKKTFKLFGEVSSTRMYFGCLNILKLKLSL